jgi:hypothetical protein
MMHPLGVVIAGGSEVAMVSILAYKLTMNLLTCLLSNVEGW